MGVRDEARIPWDVDGKRLWSVAELIECKAFQLTDIFQQLTTSIQGLFGSENRTAELHPSYKETMGSLHVFDVIEQHQYIWNDVDLYFAANTFDIDS